jgi:opacity protein-like surface antigen
MRLQALALAVASLALAAPPASARPLDPGYAVVKLGGWFPMHSDVSDYDTGFLGEIALGYAPDPGFAFELAGGAFDVVRESGGEKVREMRVYPVTFAIRGTVPVKSFQPYALLGGGAYFVFDEVLGEKDDAVDFGLFLGAGANVNLGSRLFLGLEGRYLFLGTNTFGGDTRLDGVTLTADLGFRF